MLFLSFALLIAFGGALASLVDSDPVSEDDEGTGPEVELPDDPGEDPVLDLGASLTEQEDGRILVELGDDETGYLVAMVVEQEQNVTGFGSSIDYFMTLYLVPEDVAFPQDGSELPENPTAPDGTPIDVEFGYDEEDLEAYLGLTELGAWDLGGSVVDEEAFSRDGHDPISILSNRVLPPDFVSDEPISAIFVRAEAGTPFDFARFEAEDDLSRLDGTAHLEGTNESDTFVLTDAGSLSVGGGDDVVEMNTGTFVNGGAGYDTIIVANVDFVIGGVGDDTVASDGGRTVWGGDGNDILSGTADMWAGSGDDILSGSGAMYGGDGNDTLIGSGRMSGEGGDDVLIALQNTTLRGDSSSLAGLEPSGADTFIVSIQGLSVDAPGTPVELATILDFDAEHDQLVVLTRDGVEPASMSFADGILRLNFENGATGLVTLRGVESLDVSIVTFADEDTVLGALPSGYPTT